MKQHTLHTLPLAPYASRLTTALAPVPSASPSFATTLAHNPSALRRSTTFATGHFANVTPLPIEFPYRLPVRINDKGEREAAVGVEDWLAAYEPTVKEAAPATAHSSSDDDGHDGPAEGVIYSNGQRSWPTTLLGFSQPCLDEVLPHLDAGDALAVSRGDYPAGGIDELASAHAGRDAILGLLGGREVRMDLDDDEAGLKPWSLRYGGRQFGSWASQLGDGRAISLFETALPSGEIQEIQLKGSGRTPFSRHADGLAVLRSSVREFLASEHSAAFPEGSLPTSRSLSLILLPKLQVLRENGPEPGAIVSRIAPSFLRIGSFEILNPPQDQLVFFLLRPNQPRAQPEWDNLRVLGEFVRGKLGLDATAGSWEMIREIGRRNAKMVAAWQAYGFMHGVINTDNVSALGLTIDYGPYAWMDIFKRNHICNHSDEEGRYSYANQPEMVFYAISSLLKANAELVGFEAEHGLAREGWETSVTEDGPAWRAAALAKEGELRTEFFVTFDATYRELMGKRLGLENSTADDVSTLVEPLLDLMETHTLDFTSTLRTLTLFPRLPADNVIERVLDNSTMCNLVRATKDFEAWLAKYKARLATSGRGVASQEARRLWNPRFALRQWVLEEAIARLSSGAPDARRHLARVLDMATRPFEPWGREGEEDETKLTEDEREERRLCDLGDAENLGLQCSCSS